MKHALIEVVAIIGIAFSMFVIVAILGFFIPWINFLPVHKSDAELLGLIVGKVRWYVIISILNTLLFCGCFFVLVYIRAMSKN